jgi:hypothetical protein
MRHNQWYTVSQRNTRRIQEILWRDHLTGEGIMKYTTAVFVALGVMAGVLLQDGVDTSRRKLHSLKEILGGGRGDLNVAGSAYLEEWQAFKRESERTIASNEQRIDAYKKKIAKVGPKVRAKCSKDVATFEQQNQDLKKRLSDYRDDREGKWAEFKRDFEHDMGGLGKTMSALFKRMG